MKTLFLYLALALSTFAQEAPIPLWPKFPPGVTTPVPNEERDVTKPGDNAPGGKPVVRLGNVSVPMLTVFHPPAEKATGTAIVVFPGGGYNILAYDHEGSEVCEWLNRIGVTGILVKYRVPSPKEGPRHAIPLQDAQRAISLVRKNAEAWRIDPNRIGVLGFSAGGHLALMTNQTTRSYAAVDDADVMHVRPDFSILIYPAYLTPREKPDALAPGLPVDASSPPTFISITQDDPVKVEGALHLALALQASKVPLELHIYPKGGHGYGLRRTELPVTTWPDRAEDWLRSRGLLKKP